MEHVPTLDRPFPWRAAALAAGVLAAAELAGLLALAGVRLFPVHRPAVSSSTVRQHASTQATSPPTAAVTHRLRPRAQVSVLVLNGNGISGAAGAEASTLLRHGYRSADATDAPSQEYATSLVLFKPGWQREARRLGHDAGVRTIVPLDSHLPASDRRAQLVLILGR